MIRFGKIIAVAGLCSLISCKTSAPSTRLNESVSGPASENTTAVIEQIKVLISQIRAASTDGQRTAIRSKMFSLLGQQEQMGQLKTVVQTMVGGLPSFAKSTLEQIKAASEVLHNSIKVELANRSGFDSWNDVDRKLMAAVNRTNSMALPAALEELSHTSFLPVENGRLLINGEASWELRKELVKAAQKSIWIFCWSFYNDGTGNDGIDAIIAKKRSHPEMDIRIVVDGPVQSKESGRKITQKVLDAGIGIEFINWSSPGLVGFGMHRKIMIFDHGESGEAAVFGGMNYGDNYSHENKSLPPLEQWRDTDMVVYGPVVRQAARQFAVAWNNFVAMPGPLVTTKKLTKAVVPNLPGTNQQTQNQYNSPDSDVSDWMLAFVDQDPSLKEKNSGYIDPVYAVTLKMIDSSKESVEISNAYFISSLPIERALERAYNRGVQVRVHTNSNDSLTSDDKPLLGPIYGSLSKLLNGYTEGGRQSVSFKEPQVYLQKEHTLHSKYLVVDKLFGWVGSYNIHPRSYRYESESVGMFYGTKVGAEVHRMFADDTSRSDLATAQMVELKANPLFELLQDFFFDQL